MSNIIVFKPRQELTAQEHLDAFVEFAREKLTAFGFDLPFDDIKWDVTNDCAGKGKGNKRERITFSTLASARSNNPEPLCDSFRPFAQAYLRQMQALEKVVNLGRRMAALRVIEAALTENGENLSPVKIDANILNRASQYAKEYYASTRAYQVGKDIELIAIFMTEYGLVSSPLSWRNPLPRPKQGVRVGQEFDNNRAKKMPSKAALDALPRIYRDAIEPRDVIVSATAAIFLSAPDRIGEVLTLPYACETPGLTGGDEVYGLRWWPEKGGDPMVKWILPCMIGIVKEALSKIRHVTEPARVLSRWYENNPDKLYLPKALEGLRTKDFVSFAEVRSILWGDQGAVSSVRDWCVKRNIRIKLVNGVSAVSYLEVEKGVIAMLPPSFPFLDERRQMKCVDSLMIVPKNTFRMNKPTYICVVEPVVVQQINDALGARAKLGRKSLFDAFGFTEPDGSPIKVISHQFRHYLDTLAQEGGLSQLDIAKWSGRKDIRQNEAYNHMTADEMLQIIRDSVGDNAKTIGPLANIPKQYLIRRDEFARLMIPTAHTTDIGYCVHDYTMTPCLEHMDCINCHEHVCIKGDSSKTSRLMQQFDEAKYLLEKAEVAVKDGYYGSERWLEHHRLTTERLRQLCEIMDDPKVPIGSIIQLNNVKSPSRIEQAVGSRAQLPSPAGGNDSLVEDIRGILHGEA
jgi:hypothetical protein